MYNMFNRTLEKVLSGMDVVLVTTLELVLQKGMYVRAVIPKPVNRITDQLFL